MSNPVMRNPAKIASLMALVTLTAGSTTVQGALAGPNEVFSAMPQHTPKITPKTGVIQREYQAPPPKQPDNAVTAPGALSMMSADTPELHFFETLDAITFAGYPTSAERFILKKQFDKEAERVQAWINAARSVAKRYRNTAKSLRNTPVPPGRLDIKNYRDMSADWFDEAASVYEDFIKPKAPANTMEELEEQLAQVDAKADSVAGMKTIVLTTDRNLRKLYRVHAPRETDALQNYVMGVPQTKPPK